MDQQILSDRYELLNKVGEGGMAVTYRARDRVLDRIVAVKVMRDQFTGDPEFVERFLREAQSAASLSHQHIAGVYDTGCHNGTRYIVMEYIEGEDLKGRIKREGRLPIPVVVEIAIQTAQAFEAAHAKGIVHRDIKSHNILIAKDGQVKVTDFGIAKAMSSPSHTETGTILGSVHYFSPEQARGEPVGPQSDLYSLGIVMFEMLTGRLPFQGENPVAVAHKQIYEQPPLPSKFRRDLPPDLEEVVLQCLEKNLSQRYASAGELLGYLATLRDRVAEDQTIVSPHEAAPATERMERTLRRPRIEAARPRESNLPTVVGLLVAALLVVGIVWGINYYRSLAPQIKVPDLIGLEPISAKAALADLGLRYIEAGEEFSDQVEKGRIVRQVPEPEVSIPENGAVRVWLSSGPQFVPVPDVTRMSQEQAEKLLKETNLEIGAITEEFDELVPQGYIIRSEPPTGARTEVKTEVALFISKGREQQPPQPPDEGGTEQPKVKQETITFRVPESSKQKVTVRIEMEDEHGKTVVYEEMHQPGEEIPPQKIEHTGKATIKIFVDNVPQWERSFSP